MLESFGLGPRMGRGRSYARGGQVTELEIGKGRVTAKVQGSRPRPYNVDIQFKTLNPFQWKRAAEAIKREALFAAKLLAGEMPEDLEGIFKAEKIPLFPEKYSDMATQCSCPDWSNPCKHIAAVYYLLSEEFDRDPFLLFLLLGLGRDELMSLIGLAPCAPQPTAKNLECAKEPLPQDAPSFWGDADFKMADWGGFRIPPLPGALAKQLGAFPFWRGERKLDEFLDEVYPKVSRAVQTRFMGELSSQGVCAKPAASPNLDASAPRKKGRPRAAGAASGAKKK